MHLPDRRLQHNTTWSGATSRPGLFSRCRSERFDVHPAPGRKGESCGAGVGVRQALLCNYQSGKRRVTTAEGVSGRRAGDAALSGPLRQGRITVHPLLRDAGFTAGSAILIVTINPVIVSLLGRKLGSA